MIENNININEDIQWQWGNLNVLWQEMREDKYGNLKCAVEKMSRY